MTQNIDGLHQRAGNSPDKVIEVHGTMREVMCMRCGWRGPMQPVLDRVRAGEEDPPCRQCGGILKSATISFGQALVPEVIERAMQAAEEADLLLAIGTSLQVYPIAGAVPAAKSAGARVRDCERRADAVRRDRRRGASSTDWRSPADPLQGRQIAPRAVPFLSEYGPSARKMTQMLCRAVCSVSERAEAART